MKKMLDVCFFTLSRWLVLIDNIVDTSFFLRTGADQASIELINDLLLMSGSLDTSSRFYFLGCYRDDEVTDAHPFIQMLSRVGRFGVNVTKVKLDCMSEETINSFISDLLCLSPRLTRTLSNLVYHKTQGNPLFVSKLMASLVKDKLLRLSLSRRRWEWDEEKIQQRRIPDDVAEFFSNTISLLPPQVQSALFILSCFGARSEISLVKLLERQIDVPLIQPLGVAVSEGLVDLDSDAYIFGHDRVQEASYNIYQSSEKPHYHLKQGLALCAAGVDQENGNMILFAAAGQLNLAGPGTVTEKEQAVLIANLNLLAGKKAVEMSDFRYVCYPCVYVQPLSDGTNLNN